MADSKIVGYKRMFGFILPDWVDERTVNMTVGYLMVGLVMVFALLLFINPQSDEVRKLEVEYERDSTRLEAMTESRDNMNQLIQQVSQDEQVAVFRAMPLDYSPDDAIFSLRRVANETGVSVVDYTFPEGTVFDEDDDVLTGSGGQNQETAITFRNFTVQVTVEGEIRNILNFVDRIQQTLPVAFVSDLGIQEIVRTAELRTAQTNVNLRLLIQYYQPILRSFNLAELQSFTSSELDLVKELAGFAALEPAPVFASPSAQVGGQTNLFGL